MLNDIHLIGNLGSKPELTTSSKGVTIVNFSMAVNEKVKGEDRSQWFRCVAFGKQAEYIHRTCIRGTRVYIEGPHRSETYNDKERWTVTVNKIICISGKKDY